MANLPIKYPRVFTNEILQVTEETLIIDDIENEKNEILINNDMYLKEQIETAKTTLTEHVDNTDTHVTAEQKTAWANKAEKTAVTASSDGLMSKGDKTKLDTVKNNAEENQNAFSNVKIGATTISANGKTAQVELTAGDNVTLVGDNATKKVTVAVPKLAEVEQNVVSANNKIGNTASLVTTNKSNLVSAVNECFQFASSGKANIANAIGSPATTGNTFPELAAEIVEEKRLIAAAAGVSAPTETLRTQAGSISVYTHTHLPNIITANGGALVNSQGGGITAADSTLDSAYHSIQNLANVKNGVIGNLQSENSSLNVGLANMTADRNNWLNLANSKKSYISGITTTRRNRTLYEYGNNKAVHITSVHETICDISLGFQPEIILIKPKLGLEYGISYPGGVNYSRFSNDNWYGFIKEIDAAGNIGYTYNAFSNLATIYITLTPTTLQLRGPFPPLLRTYNMYNTIFYSPNNVNQVSNSDLNTMTWQFDVEYIAFS